jgi:hypothetical protein
MKSAVLDQGAAAYSVGLPPNRSSPERSGEGGMAAVAPWEESDFHLSPPKNPFDAASLSSARALLLVLALCVFLWGLIGLAATIVF